MRRGASGELEPVSWEEAIRQLGAEIGKNPSGTWLLGGDPGATAGRLLDDFVAAVGAGGRVVHEPFAAEALREASRAVFGAAGVPVFDLTGADLVVDFGFEALETGLSPAEHARQLAEARDVKERPAGGARLVYVGPRLSMTASNADEWLPAKPGTEGILALALARLLLESGGGAPGDAGLLGDLLAGADVASAAKATGLPAESIERLGRALARAQRAVALPPGVAATSRRAVGATAAVLLLDHVLGAVGRSVHVPADTAQAPAHVGYRDVLALVEAMKAGSVSVLLVHDLNPLHSLPAGADFAEALAKVPLVVAFAPLADETAARAHLVLPDHTPLESWGDVVPREGVRSLVQPTLRPLYDTRALGDTILDVGRAVSPEAAAKLPTGSFRTVLEQAWADADFRAARARGGIFDGVAAGSAPALAAGAARLEVVEPKLTGEGEFTLLAFPHAFLWDGRGANLPWLQEIPDTVTKIAWQSWAELSRATAERLGVEIGDVIAIETSAGRIEVPVFPRGGLRDDVVAVPIGQGHSVGHWASMAESGRPGEVRGVNVLDVLPAGVDEKGGRAWLLEKAKVSATGRVRRLPLLQFSDNKRQRQLAEAVSLVALAEGNGHGGEHGEAHGDGHGEVHEIRKPYDPADDAARAKPGYFEESPYRWGMSVDLDRCTGCSACVAACYVENNVPVVGEQETLRVRQMAWLRIERYVGEGEPDLVGGRVHPLDNREQFGDTDVRHSPMMCQQCGSAPCEPVCPVIATYHNDEGLNAMIYNRCIGTRYCANNCPYKVRRFNFFDHQIERWPEPMRLMLNPDVTARGQGVMEKCTYCIQRIQAARQTAKDEGRPIADGEVQTACQQACPTQAIHFGNLRDPKSTVRGHYEDEKRGYHALHMLNTRPATTYLAKVERGKVEG
jgi:molybdopterin-containing oxidoreductase family iron-sulfur binding subunit